MKTEVKAQEKKIEKESDLEKLEVGDFVEDIDRQMLVFAGIESGTPFIIDKLMNFYYKLLDGRIIGYQEFIGILK